jgi:hypothetical protein
LQAARRGAALAAADAAQALRIPAPSPAAKTAGTESGGSTGAGVGISLDFKDGKLVVKKLQQGGAAWRSGQCLK